MTYTIHDPFFDEDVEIYDRLTDRLRGRYAVGPTMPNGEPEFGWRELPTNPVQVEAANEIERLQKYTEWHPFETLPDRPMQVELFYGDLVLTDTEGAVVSAVIEPYRDERRALGYFDGEVFRQCGTGHIVPDYGDPPVWTPTHWRELPPVPEEKHDPNQGPEEG